MTKRTRPTYSPEFRLEVAQEVVDKDRSIKDVSESLGLGNRQSINGQDSLNKSVTVSFLALHH